ncbi:carbohydrate kinase [Mucilaginibacter sp. dw_454]|uniref:carbohydrate kinase family protein n=1 Tax=Mucilaginibacter sp. dw_454 TaxID=2720079 RepID=UPI001BD66590|nr:carbohydrate kinase [Mucilaginibacter sp. dw_454]
MKQNILCLGEVLWDAFGDEKVAGGATMNVAFHLAQQGAGVAFASSVGTDASGNELVDFLKDNALFSDLIQRDEHLPTCEVTVQLDEQQQATYIIPQPVSWDNIKTKSALTKCAKSATAIVFGSLVCREKKTRDTLLNLLNETNALKIFDVNLRAPHYTLQTIENLAARADVVKMNEEEADLLINTNKGDLKEKINEFRSKYHAQTICVTRGAHGAIVWHDHKFYEHPGFEVKVADTVGAGDSFLATFIVGLLNKLPMEQVLERACAVGAYVASKRGATPRYVDGIVDLIAR